MSANDEMEAEQSAHTAVDQVAADQQPQQQLDQQPDQQPDQQLTLAAVAQDLSDIRTILLAAATNLSVEVPVAALPLLDLVPLRPNQESYNEESVLKYKMAQVPTDEIFESRSWNESYLQPPKPNVVRPVLDPNARGLQIICTWNIKSHYAQFDIKIVFGYNCNGYLQHKPNPCPQGLIFGRPRSGGRSEMHYKFTETAFISEPTTLSGDIPIDQSFATEWFFEFEKGIEKEKLPVIVLQFCKATDFTTDQNHLYEDRITTTKRFLAQFIENWTPSQSYWGDSGLGDSWSTTADREDVVFQYHLRFFTTFDHLQGRDPWNEVAPKRITGVVISPNSNRELHIKERRYSIGLRTTWQMDLPMFSLVTMSDTSVNSGKKWELHDASIWQNFDIQPSNRATGIAAFALRIHLICSLWQAQWIALFDGIDDVLEVDLQNILSHDRRVKIMYDTEALELSEFYFAILQILLIAGDWIQESMDDLQHMVDSMEEHFFSTPPRQPFSFLPDSQQSSALALEVFKRNWASVLSHQQRLGEGLLNRISKKQEEVKSLRDGLFNATSVREAAKSTQLNHYILIFTIVTIFYLPLGFVTALFALELFDWDQSYQRVAFSVTLALVAGGTYCIAGFLIWAVRNPKRRLRFFDDKTALEKKKQAGVDSSQGAKREMAPPQEAQNSAETKHGFWEGVAFSLRERRKGTSKQRGVIV